MTTKHSQRNLGTFTRAPCQKNCIHVKDRKDVKVSGCTCMLKVASTRRLTLDYVLKREKNGSQDVKPSTAAITTSDTSTALITVTPCRQHSDLQMQLCLNALCNKEKCTPPLQFQSFP